MRVGVVGLGRGLQLAEQAGAAGMELVALCDTTAERLAAGPAGVATYTDYARFLRHDLDAVVVANAFHQHAPLAIAALRAGRHVLSETACNATLAEGVALCRAVEETGATYMLAENYPFLDVAQAMAEVYASGEIGTVTYAEGDYNHPLAPHEWHRWAPSKEHWRSWLPPTLYCTHALAPLMTMTDTRPASVTAMAIPLPELSARLGRSSDPGAVMLCRMDSGAVFRIFGLLLPGHRTGWRVHGSAGAMEGQHEGSVRVWHESWDAPAGGALQRSIDPPTGVGHDPADVRTLRAFAAAVSTGAPPLLDVHRGVAMSSAGILAWRSALAGGAPQPVPDFRDEADRRRVADDHWNPAPPGAR